MLAQKLGVWIPLDEVRRRLGGRRLDLPRLRLPPAALAGPPEVPGRRLGRREVPRGARERVPRPRARPLRLAALPRRPPRPHRRARAEGRQASTSASRRPPAGSPAPCWSQLADLMERVRRRRRPPHAVPEDRADRRRRRTRSSRWSAASTRSACRRGRRTGGSNTMACTGIEFCKLAIVDTKDRARDLVDGARAALPRPRHADHRQRQRLPQRLRPHPGRRHRPQGPAGHARRRAGRGLPGAPRRRDRPAGQLRPQAARPQGDQRRPRRLRHRRGHQLPRRPRGRASRSRPGSPAPTRSCCAARRPWRGRRHERARRSLPLPLLRGRGPVAARRDARGSLGMPRLPARLHPEDARPREPAHPRQGAHRHDRCHHPRPPATSAGTDTEGRSPEELRELVSHWGAELELAPGRGHHRVGRRDVRRALLRHLVDGRRGARRPRLQGRARHRRGLPRHRLPLRRDHRHPRRRRGDDAEST